MNLVSSTDHMALEQSGEKEFIQPTKVYWFGLATAHVTFNRVERNKEDYLTLTWS